MHACNRTVGQCSYYVAEGALEVISLRDVLDLLIWHLSDLYAAMPIGRMGFDGGLPIEAIRFDCCKGRVLRNKCLSRNHWRLLYRNRETSNHVKCWCEAELSAANVELDYFLPRRFHTRIVLTGTSHLDQASQAG